VRGLEQEHTEAPYLSQVRNCVIVSNAAPYGGGMAMVSCENVVMEHNRAREWGGGLYLGAAYRSRIANNAANTAGGAYAVAMSNCMIVGNSAAYEGGGVVGGWSSLLDSCTVVGNSAAICGGISRATAHNSLLYYNTAVTYPNFAPAGLYLGSYLYFSCSTPLAEGTQGINNIADEPRIASLLDPHLLPGSPCINAGTNKPGLEAAQDFDGDLRINGDRVDLGADEFWPIHSPIRFRSPSACPPAARPRCIIRCRCARTSSDAVSRPSGNWMARPSPTARLFSIYSPTPGNTKCA